MSTHASTTPFDRLGSDLRALLHPHVGDMRYKDMLQATRQAFYDITEELRDRGLTWAQVTELTGAPRTTINSIPFETVRPVAFKNRFLTELRRKPDMQMSRSEAARLYYEMRDEEDALVAETEENRRSGMETFLKALASMGLIVLLDDRRRSIRAAGRSDSTVSPQPAGSVMSSIRAYANRIVDKVVSRTTRHSARMYRTHFDIRPQDLGAFLDEWKEQTLALVRRYEADARESGGAEQVAIVYGGAAVDDITQVNGNAASVASGESS